ncbi:type VI secretion system-associated protein TagF [uncultured Pseudacidovorax sp.]|uniref:type VI secretion system-associated protein TagF n=1 Tax=uncultured Pseudacidovorax sp. TaxID=679313 RepID=UPI002600D5D7|nr:type VI secretion system-associated protein TagF [uncultured Pseudacidovorax sp.]
MLTRLMGLGSVTEPAIWGKLPAHADFVRSRVRHGESDGWTHWLADVKAPSGDAGKPTGMRGGVPVAFLLPPGALPFATRRFVLGVIAPSVDRVGRRHPLLVYQLARAAWVIRHFTPPRSRDWLFWLARAVALHGQRAAPADIQSLQAWVQGLWQLHDLAQATPRPLPRGEPGETSSRLSQDAIFEHEAECFLDARAGVAPVDGVASSLQGVRCFPWVDWPQRLVGPRPAAAFWQQDARGGYVNAADGLQQLWSAVS